MDTTFPLRFAGVGLAVLALPPARLAVRACLEEEGGHVPVRLAGWAAIFLARPDLGQIWPISFIFLWIYFAV